MKARIIILSVICASCTTMWGQTLRAYITAAENAMAEKDFYTAFTHFGTAVDIDSNRVDLIYKLGEAAWQFHSYAEAERMYSKVLESEVNTEYPQAAFWLGQAQQIQGKYDSAIASYQIYLGEHAGDDSLYTAEANRMIESCRWAKDNLRTTN
ncbi:MAG: tetratricopeptide repeat protein, partial [Saprospiraceae bacterium]|nr:tetratricopeptide repeat protein [Saprospiraceae bacterium]